MKVRGGKRQPHPSRYSNVYARVYALELISDQAISIWPRKSRSAQETARDLSDRSRYVIKIIGIHNAIEHVFPMDYVSNGGQVGKTL